MPLLSPHTHDSQHSFGSLQMNMDLDKEFDVVPYGVDYGTLENGLVYYVKCNPKPRKRASLALAVKVGSILEEEDERGVAHIVEHLAFSATKKYTNHSIVKFLESIGAEFGPCQNAETSFDETVYKLLIPIDKPELLSEAIQVLAEFSSEIRLSKDDLEKERGAVMEEYRDNRNASGRILDAYWTLMMEGSKYADRLPIGLEKVIKTVSPQILKQFYQKWYHLSNMAVIAVGDFSDTKRVIELIKINFGHKYSALDPPPIPQFKVPPHEDPRFSYFVEPEASGSAVVISYKMQEDEMKTVKDYREMLVKSMFRIALNRRLFRISRRKDPPYFSCSIASYVLVRDLKAYIMTSSCKEKGTLEALESMLIEIARVRLHGLSEREISVARALLMSSIESAYLERDQMESSSLRYDYTQHFTDNKPIIGIEYEAQLHKFILPDILASEVSKFAEKLWTSYSCVIQIVEPQAFAVIDDMKNIVMKINELEKTRSISPWDDEHVPEEIVNSKPNTGNIVEQREHVNIGATELTLSNGMRVCYKCTDFFNDQVLFTGFSYGGLSELPESIYYSSSMGSAIAEEIGMFGHRPSVLMDMLAGKRVDVDIDIRAYKRTFYGDCSPLYLETAFQLVYQLFTTKVTPDDEVIKRVMQVKEEAILARERDPYTSFSNRAWEINYGNSYFFRPFKINDLQKVNPLKACEYFNTCFKDPSTFTVVIVGKTDPTVAVPLILKYLGGIEKPPQPILHFHSDYIKGLPFKYPESTTREVVCSPMIEAQCMVRICFPIELKNVAMEEEIHYTGFLTKLLETKLLQLLRFKHGQIYSASVLEFIDGDLPCLTGDIRGDIRIDFSCDPKISLKLVDLALNEILRLQEEGPSDQDVETILEIEQIAHENGLQENYYWLNQILCSYQSRIYSGDIGTSFKILDEGRSKVRKSLTPLTMQLALQRIMPRRNLHTVVILMPQTSWFKRIKSFSQWSRQGIDMKILAAIAGFTVLALGFRRYSKKS
ncbi:Mitochondrial-processing peptidase subunit beta [Hibiscus syriacus]|uniref:Mitochondrial-processing peptidase subunit beta n=1 Tax=Hibiscus syriacus TaxID=106335 RepID=A0A6A3A5J2_HIBSY|nr:zinc protease PQQL-like [Hibiscus syriacus]KAE8698399.1 Mitochondrial-processing peptidase subunit beta [Hibiscus syriacus]